MNLTVRVEGVSVLDLKVKYLIDAAKAGLRAGVSEAAGLIETEAKAIVPVDTGNLRDAIHTEDIDTSAERQVKAVTPAYEADNDYGFDPAYARRIEFGFVGQDRLGRMYHQAPQPYMRPALDAKEAEARQAIKDGVIEQLDSAMSAVAAKGRAR